jgi:transposase
MKKGSKLDDYMVLRRRAIELYQQGKTQKFIVQALGVSQPSVSRWIKAFKERGEASLARPQVGGSIRRLTPEQIEQLVKMLDEGAAHHGFEGNVWTRARVKELIERKFGVTYQVRTLSDLLRDLGYTLQKPDRRSYRQDPEKVREWRAQTLPELKKKR